MAQCTATTTTGARCLKPTLGKIDFCGVHNPDRKPYSRKPYGKIGDALSVTDIIKMQSKLLKSLSIKARKVGLDGKELQSFSSISNSLLKAQKEQLQVDRLDKIEKMLLSQAK